MTKSETFVCAVLAALALPASASAAEVYNWGTIKGGLLKADSPKPVEGLEGVAHIDASNHSDYVLKTNGTVWAWGENAEGTLGDGRSSASTTPVQVQIPVALVALGEARDSGAAIDAEGNGWVWGQNDSGDMCVPHEPWVAAPEHPAALTGLQAVQGGETHTMWLTKTGHVLVCGACLFGSLGVGEQVQKTPEPLEVPGISHVVEMTSGDRQVLVRTERGEVYAWGGNEHGQTCTGSSAKRVYTPERVILPEPAKQISGGGNLETDGQTLIVLDSGAVYGCGDNKYGQADPSSSVQELSKPTNTGLDFAYAVTGAESSLGLTQSGELFAWGNGKYGDLGNGEHAAVRTPTRIDTGVKAVSATADTVLDLH